MTVEANGMLARWAPISLAGLLIFMVTGIGRAEEIAPGVTHAVYYLGTPNVVHVVAIDRLRSEYKLKVGWPQQKRNFTSKARTSTIASLYDDPPDNDVLAATNGAFFDPVNLPTIIGTATTFGEIVEEPDGENDTYLFGPSRQPAIRAEITHAAGTLTFANGTSIPLGYYNRPNPPIHNVTAYTPGWDSSTRSDFISPSLAVEVILSDVSYPMRGDKEVSGIVTAIQTGSAAENNAIPDGGMVLTAWGIPKTTIVANTAVGDRLRMRFATAVEEYNNADFAITGIGWIIHNGVPYTGNWANRGAAAPYSRNPRTALGWSDNYLFMVVCDGRSPVSVGMTFSEMANFLTSTLGATDAINLDGGGSSTMVVNGTVRNVPSDGSERYVANAVMLVKEETATTFPFSDPLAASGRLPGWDDKFTYNAVTAFSPSAPGGDGYVIVVADPDGGAETVRRGNFGDTDYAVEADIYCEYRSGVAGDGFERCGLFARDSGTGAFGLSDYGGGNCYAMTFDSNDGRIRAGKYVDGTLTDFLAGDPLYRPASAWYRFRIHCEGSTIRYHLDDDVIVSVTDTTHDRGYFGLGYHEFFATDSNIHGTRADNLLAYIDITPIIPGDFDLDSDVDQEDFGHLQACLTGSGQPQMDPACLDARLDGDRDVDPNDWAIFEACISGPNVPADPGCAPG